MNNKGADQSARMRRLVCVFVVPKPPNTGFLETRSIFKESDRVIKIVYSKLRPLWWEGTTMVFGGVS